jgi:hypothetical protein
MEIGDFVYTPRFCNVRIENIFDSKEEAYKEGYTEPTHYNNPEYDILGKHIGTNRMIFAEVLK